MNRSRRALTRALRAARLALELERLLGRALAGDGRAVAALAIGFGPMLLAVARTELGPVEAPRAARILDDLFTSMRDGRPLPPPLPGRPVAWMAAAVRALARTGAEEPVGPVACRQAPARRAT